MTKIFALILISLTVFSCQHSPDNSSADKSTLPIDTSLFTILRPDTNIDEFKSAVENPQFKIDNKDIEKIEFLLSDAVKSYNKNDSKAKFEEWKKSYDTTGAKWEHFLIDLKKYKRQYIPFTTSRGQKIVYVNCFREDDDKMFASPEWRKHIVIAEGGGMSYFHLKVSLDDINYFDFSINPFE
jgi:hypothetical protein